MDILIGMIGGAIVTYSLLEWHKRWCNVISYPPLSRGNKEALFGELSLSCNHFVDGAFIMMTGMDLDIVRYLQSSLDNGNLCQKVEPEEQFHSLVYIWSPLGEFGETTMTHHLIFYKGYLYQSYLVYRQWYREGYPPIRLLITSPEVGQIFMHHPEELTVLQFNQWCAPECCPIPLDAPLRLVRHHSSPLNPACARFNVTINNTG
jgi:hypothetical protein